MTGHTDRDLLLDVDDVTWHVRDADPAIPSEAPVVLGLAAGFCTAEFLADLQAALSDVRLVAAALPGHGGTPPLPDPTVEAYADAAAGLARELGATVVLGHSLGANVALELAASGRFSGPVVLLAPSLSRRDEAPFARVLERLGEALGDLPFALTSHLLGPALKDELPPERYDALEAGLRRNVAHDTRASMHRYFAYLDQHGDLAPRLVAAGVPAWLVLGEEDDVTLAEPERTELEAGGVRVVMLAGAGHFTAIQRPTEVAAVVREALAART